jgi:hypothetical protein
VAIVAPNLQRLKPDSKTNLDGTTEVVPYKDLSVIARRFVCFHLGSCGLLRFVFIRYTKKRQAEACPTVAPSLCIRYN